MPPLPQTWVPWIDCIGWALLHFLWQGAALGVVFVLLRPACRTVAGRYRLGMSMLALLTLCPLGSVLWMWPPSHAASDSIALPATALAAAQPLLAETASWQFESVLRWLVAIWSLGVVAIAGRAFFHWRRLNWLVLHAAAPLPECRDSLSKLCRRFGIRRPVRLLASLRVATPMLIGWFKPVILLPASMFSGFTPHQIELIIAHELGHVRRWDYLANLFQVIVETVLFYHPVVHWISRDVRNARESCCDDLVLALGEGSPVAYARALADLETLRHDVGVVAPALGASGGVLLTRIRRIVGLQRDFYDPLPRDNSWLLLVGMALAVLAALRLHAPPALPTPLQSMALISGNSSVAAALRAAPVEHDQVKSVPQVPVAPPSEQLEPSGAVDFAPAPIARPHVRVAPPATAMPVKNVPIEKLNALPVLVAAEQTAVDEPASAPSFAAPIPAATHIVQPRYPTLALAAGDTGTVTLEFSITADGGVRDIRVIGAHSRALEEAAVVALRQWRFETSVPIDSGRRYTQAFAFTRPNGVETCHEVIGSHICRRLPD
jgi:TonB family protein